MTAFAVVSWLRSIGRLSMTEIDDGDENEAEYIDDGDEDETPPDETDERYLPDDDDQDDTDTAEDTPE